MPFEPTGLGKTIFEERYARFEGETWDQASLRVASHVAQAEEDEKIAKWTERFADEITSGRFMPGGRIWFGSGRPKGQLLNCFVVPTADSREGWGKTISDVIVVSGLGGGVGINASPVRPRGASIHGTGGEATGAVSLMQMIDRVGDVLVGGGGRRLALMLALDVTHPDLPEFLDVKLDKNELNNANVSVILPRNVEDFIEAVRSGGDIRFRHAGRELDTGMEAGDLWTRLVQNAWSSGEPGILNGELANVQNNIWYHKPLICTNPCGEIWLEEYGSCDLGALVLPRFVRNGDVDWEALDSSIRAGVRFLDDVLTVNYYPLSDIGENSQSVRRLGLGVMGLHSLLLEVGLSYSGRDTLEFVDVLFSFIKNTAYDASINIAIEKGPFPAYDPRLLDSGFARTLKRGIRSKIKEHGLRNCALLTIAPTGTTGMVQGVSTGIEPLFAPAYLRRYRTGNGRGKELVVTPEFHKFGELAEGAYDVSVDRHFAMQRTVQAHVDNAVSKTINLPADYPVENLSSVWLEYLPDIKGSTFYRAGSRGEEPLEPVSSSDAKQYGEGGELLVSSDDQYVMDCPEGVCLV